MTARASTLEDTCSSCRFLVLTGDASTAPLCVDCSRVVCARCQLGGLCAACFHRHYSAPLEALDDEHATLVVVDGRSEFGVRPSIFTQPLAEDADEHRR